MERYDDTLDERLEQIPWAELAKSSTFSQNRVAYLAAGAVVLAAVGFFAGRSLMGTPSRVAVPVTAAAPVATVAPTAVTAPPSTLPAPQVYAEADLMALAPGRQEQLAEIEAEVFVRGYFSTAGNPATSLAVMGALPDGAVVPAGSGGVTYVEWARAFRIDPLGDDLYRVGVMFGLLSGPDLSTLNRLEPEAVDVVVQVDGDAAAVVELPLPSEPPGRAVAAPWPEPASEIPAGVGAAATEQAARWGADPEVVEAAQSPDGWRVVLLVGDKDGNRWPMAVWINPSGSALVPPWQVGG